MSEANISVERVVMPTVEDLLSTSVEAWNQAQGICLNRDLEQEEKDPGQGELCRHPDNGNIMGWCEPGDCPRAGF